MAVRQYTIQLANYSGNTLTLLTHKFCDGEWSSGMAAPSSIPTGRVVTFRAESDAVLRGTEGYVIYSCPDNSNDPSITSQDPAGTPTQLYVYWDNPYIGTTRAGVIVSTADIESTFLQGNCSAQFPSTSSSSGSQFAPPPPPPSIFRVDPPSTWSSETAGAGLNYIYPLSSGSGESGEAGLQLAASLIPVYGIYEFFGSLFGNVGNMPDAVNYFAFSLQPKFFEHPVSLRKFLLDMGVDLSKGLRELATKPSGDDPISVRRMMELLP
jgi:hypothetical protein